MSTLSSIIQQLEGRASGIGKAIAALRQIDPVETFEVVSLPQNPSTVTKRPVGHKRGGLTAAGRKALSDSMKARWAVARKKKTGIKRLR